MYDWSTNDIYPTLAYGIPVGVAKAGNNLFPRSCASSSSSPRYQGRWKCPVRLAKMWPDNNPPSTRIVVSKSWGLVLTSKDTHSSTFLTAFSNPSRSSRTTNVSNTSISVNEKLPATSFAAKLFLCADFILAYQAYDEPSYSRINPIRPPTRTR
jgi:hypothetical protein